MPTYFQFLTCMSFYVFKQEKVDTAIIEVGIGGQFDFTNIIEYQFKKLNKKKSNLLIKKRKPIACGITSLGLDHCSLLGNTIEQIAWQKAGILKVKTKLFQARKLILCIEFMRRICSPAKFKGSFEYY